MNHYSIKLFLLGLTCLLISCSSLKKDPTPKIQEVTKTCPKNLKFGICIDSLDMQKYQIKQGDNLGLIFSKHGFSAAQTDHICHEITEVLDPTKLQAGMSYYVFTDRDTLSTIKDIVFAKSLTDFAVIAFDNDKVSVQKYNKSIKLVPQYIEGAIFSSLWNTIDATGASPLLALKLSNIFAWQIDFFDVKKGDSFKVMYNEAYIDDSIALNIDQILGASFTHQGKTYTAIPFTQDSIREYFDLEGNSLRKAFLKAPLDFYRITSRFTNRRFHPVLKIYRAHHGIDYAAPTGTPIHSIGAGTIIAKGYQRGGGNYIKIKHNSVYTTSYMHMSRFASNVHPGVHVDQAQVIGYVGATGLATGPHLDFRVYKNGSAINPLNMEAPPSLPIRPELKDSFEIVKQHFFAKMDSLRLTFINKKHFRLKQGKTKI